jgi:TonB family protein
MFEPLTQHLFAPGLLSLREVVRLLLLSGLFTAVCVLAFPRNAPTRRLLLIAAVTALMVLPWLLASVDALWYVGVDKLPSITLSWTLPNILLWIWLAIAVLMIGRHLLDVKLELADVTRLPVISDVSLVNRTARLAHSLGIEAPQIRQGGAACSTTLTTPTIVLPSVWQQWESSTLDGVLAHELVHIKHRDDRWMLLTRLVVLTYWWMPWLIVLYRLHVRAMEESCDDRASETVGHQLQYVDALVNAAKNDVTVGGDRPTPAVAYPAATQMYQHHLVGRVGRFAQLRDVEVDMRGLYWCMIGILVTVIFLPGIQPLETRVILAPPKSHGMLSTHPLSVAAPVASAIPQIHERLLVPDTIPANARERFLRPIRNPHVIYPGFALQKNLEGDVVVEFTVSNDGRVTSAAVIASTQNGVFDVAALRAIQSTVYAPTYKNVRTAYAAAHAAARATPLGTEPRLQRHLQFRLYAD